MTRYIKLVSQFGYLRNARQINYTNFIKRKEFSTCRCLFQTDLQNIEKPKHEDSKKKEETKEKKSWYQRINVQGALRLKDLTDYLVYGAFAVAIYYAYKKYDDLKEFKKEMNAQIIEIKDFKHKFYSIKDYIIPEFIVNKLQDLKAFEVRNSDVWIASFPKSGTTWVQELVYLIQTDSDFTQAKSKTIEERSPFFEYPSPGLKIINKMESPRIIKTHMPLEFLPDDVEKKSKVIYVLRNPKDVTISLFYFIQMSTQSGYKGGLTEFIELFKEGQVPYGPWWKHVDSFTDKKKNVHVIHYEDLQNKPKETLLLLSKFLGKDLSENELDDIIKWCSFDSMKKNPMTNYEWNKVMGLFKKGGEFYRKGKVGDWLQHFSLTQSKEYDDIIEKKLKYETKLDYGISKDDLNKIYEQSKITEN